MGGSVCADEMGVNEVLVLTKGVVRNIDIGIFWIQSFEFVFQ